MSTPSEVLEIALPGLTVSALAWGPADGRLVLALHGFPDTAHTWRHLGPHLAGLGLRVVAPHSRGYAPTSVPADGVYAVGALMADAVALHAALGGDEHAVLVGHDWGAVTAHALGAHPDSPFARIVAMAVPPIAAMSGGGPLRLLRQARMSWYMAFHQLPVLPERVLDPLVDRLWRDWSPGYDATEDLVHVHAALADPAHRNAAVGYYRAPRRLGALPPAYAGWHRTWTATPVVPTLYLHGRQDGCLQAAYADRTGDLLPPGSDVVVVEGAGHFLQVERPDVVDAAVAAFLS